MNKAEQHRRQYDRRNQVAQINGAEAAEATAHSEGGGGGAAPVSPVLGRVEVGGGYFVKKMFPVKAERLVGTGKVTTDSGESLGYVDGDMLMTSQDGQSWPVSAEYFARNYEPYEEAAQGRVEVGLHPHIFAVIQQISESRGETFDDVLGGLVLSGLCWHGSDPLGAAVDMDALAAALDEVEGGAA